MILGRWQVIFESLLTHIQIYREGYNLPTQESVCPTASKKKKWRQTPIINYCTAFCSFLWAATLSAHSYSFFCLLQILCTSGSPAQRTQCSITVLKWGWAWLLFKGSFYRVFSVMWQSREVCHGCGASKSPPSTLIKLEGNYHCRVKSVLPTCILFKAKKCAHFLSCFPILH